MSADLGQQYNEVLAAADVATYGALAGLASFSRAEMRSKIIDNIAFREYLELVPEVGLCNAASMFVACWVSALCTKHAGMSVRPRGRGQAAEQPYRRLSCPKAGDDYPMVLS